MEWFIENRQDLTRNVACMQTAAKAHGGCCRWSTATSFGACCSVMLDENEFLSPYGIRALSRYHKDDPYVSQWTARSIASTYEPAESTNGLFGGNSNWRGPIWFPVNYPADRVAAEVPPLSTATTIKVECPTGSGQFMTLWEVAAEISRRLTRIFLRDDDGRRPVHGSDARYRDDPHWRDLVLFYEYFHGDDGSGVGASHQTGWTGLVAKCCSRAESDRDRETPVGDQWYRRVRIVHHHRVYTRRYHGLLVAATKSPFARMVLLAKLDETIVCCVPLTECSGADIGGYTQPGSNGLTYDREGRLTSNQHGNRRMRVGMETAEHRHRRP